MKSSYYVASVVSSYRKELDRYWNNPRAISLIGKSMEELKKASHRPFTTGFYFKNR
jgi:putative protease